jgi:hypothetical protein
MDVEKVLAVRLRLRGQELRMQELLERLPPNSAAELSDEMMALLIESGDLRDELKFLCDDSSDADEPGAFIGVALKPRPPRAPGAISLREPPDCLE